MLTHADDTICTAAGLDLFCAPARNDIARAEAPRRLLPWGRDYTAPGRGVEKVVARRQLPILHLHTDVNAVSVRHTRACAVRTR